MKILHTAFLVLLLAVSAARAEEENRYDLLGRMLRPFVSLLAEHTSSPNRALRLVGRIEVLSDAPPGAVGSQADLMVEYPDKLRLHAPVLGEDVTLCRSGQDVWAYPGSKIDALLKAAKSKKKLPKVDPSGKLPNFSLPIPEQQLVFLPALFQIKDVGSEPLDGAKCRVLDVFLMPQLAKKDLKDWAARVWIRGDGTPARLSLAHGNWNLVVRFETVEFSPHLPESTWEPTPEQSADLLKLDPERYQRLLGAIAK